jgi:hypothetical protein
MLGARSATQRAGRPDDVTCDVACAHAATCCHGGARVCGARRRRGCRAVLDGDPNDAPTARNRSPRGGSRGLCDGTHLDDAARRASRGAPRTTSNTPFLARPRDAPAGAFPSVSFGAPAPKGQVSLRQPASSASMVSAFAMPSPSGSSS